MDEVSIRSLEDARRYRDELSARKPEDDPALTGWHFCKRCTLFLVLAAAALMYYLVVVNIEVLSLPELTMAVNISK